ncbi:pAP2 family protein [Clostridium sp. CAG:921]|nr:pAP2 family protein [Clostridium sp. CAG:921]
MKGDVIGYNIISKLLMSDTMTSVAKIITNFGGPIYIIIIAIIFAIAIKNKKISISVFTNLIVVTLINQIIKNILQRPRPTEYRIIEQGGYSFPSGHSMVSMAFYGYFIYLIFRYIKNKYLKYILSTLLLLLIISIGISRIYLGVHYTSDVLGGFLLSISYLIIYVSITKKVI